MPFEAAFEAYPSELAGFSNDAGLPRSARNLLAVQSRHSADGEFPYLLVRIVKK